MGNYKLFENELSVYNSYKYLVFHDVCDSGSKLLKFTPQINQESSYIRPTELFVTLRGRTCFISLKLFWSLLCCTFFVTFKRFLSAQRNFLSQISLTYLTIVAGVFYTPIFPFFFFLLAFLKRWLRKANNMSSIQLWAPVSILILFIA